MTKPPPRPEALHPFAEVVVMSSRIAALAVVGLTLFASSARAQSDDKDVIAMVNRFFDGMRTRDTAMLRSLVVPSTPLVTAPGQDGMIQPHPIDDFIGRIG